MTFIRTIPPAEAEGAVRDMYDQVRERFGYVTNWAQAFSLRPGVRDGWTALLKSIQSNLPVRTYELVTLATARALRCSYCSLAHGQVLAEKVFDAASVTAIAAGAPEAPLEPRERALMAFAEKVALDADRITGADVDELRAHGCRDEEIFDIAAAAAARCFFSKLLDALGVEPDAAFADPRTADRRGPPLTSPVLRGARPAASRAARPPASGRPWCRAR